MSLLGPRERERKVASRLRARGINWRDLQLRRCYGKRVQQVAVARVKKAVKNFPCHSFASGAVGGGRRATGSISRFLVAACARVNRAREY